MANTLNVDRLNDALSRILSDKTGHRVDVKIQGKPQPKGERKERYYAGRSYSA